MKKIIYILIVFLTNILFVLPLFLILNLSYPVFKLLYNKFKLFSINHITPELKREMHSTIKSFSYRFQIEDKQKFYDLIEKFIKYEQSYVYDMKNEHYCYQRIRYSFRIIELAQEGIYKLSQVNKDNKTIAFYENRKNSSIDELIKEFTLELEAKGHKKKHIRQAVNETKLKRLLSRMKKPNSKLFFNFYLTVLSLYSLDDLKARTKEKNRDALELAKSMFEFLSVGHATSNQINKSVAIQLYYYYKDAINKEELQKMIGELIDLCLHTETPYMNFNNIDQEPYIKNIVDKFPIFECSNDLALKQNYKAKRFFIHKNPFLPSFLPLILKKYLINKFITKPIQYYQKNAVLTFFGFTPIKF